MGNLAIDTAVTKISPQQFTATLSSDWEIWGPNGGYVAAIALRSVAELSDGMLPASLYCQYLSVGKFDVVDIAVNCIKEGRNARAFDVVIQQQGKTLLKALIWLTRTVPGLEHNFVTLPSTWVPLHEIAEQDAPWPFKFWRNFSLRQLQPDTTPDRKASSATATNWYKYKGDFNLQDPFLNAARSVVLIDTMQWPAANLAYDEGTLQHLAPSLDLFVQFHNNHSTQDWLFSEAAAEFAERGLIAGNARVWDADGTLLASGGSQLLCLPLK